MALGHLFYKPFVNGTGERGGAERPLKDHKLSFIRKFVLIYRIN